MAGKAIEMTGKVVGRLTVKDMAFVKNQTVYWNCTCECGNEKIICGSNLRRKNRASLSCGCLQREFAKSMHSLANNVKYSHEELRFSVIKHHVKNGAKGRNISYELSDNVLATIIELKCYYCDRDPSNILSVKRNSLSRITYQGVDRIDSSLGYLDSNVRPCCKWCNISKSTMSDEQFLDHISRIFNNLKGKKQ